MTRFYDHYSDVPAEDWRWPDFSPAEIACRGTGKLKLHAEAMDKLQALRDRLGKPLIVNSAIAAPSTTAPSVGRRARSTWVAPRSISPWRTMTPRPSSGRRARSGSSDLGSTRARASCMSIWGRRVLGRAVPGAGGSVRR